LSQITQPARHTATVIGTVTDVNGGVIPNATVVLREAQNNQPTTILATRNGLFQFNDVAPGSTFQLRISAKDFSDWTTPLITVHPGRFKIVTGIQLRGVPFQQVHSKVRGPMRADKGRVHNEVKASDHFPISFDLAR
jgi:hypothetical protein